MGQKLVLGVKKILDNAMNCAPPKLNPIQEILFFNINFSH